MGFRDHFSVISTTSATAPESPRTCSALASRVPAAPVERVALNCLRQALFNIERHAAASLVIVTLDYRPTGCGWSSDDGRGLPAVLSARPCPPTAITGASTSMAGRWSGWAARSTCAVSTRAGHSCGAAPSRPGRDDRARILVVDDHPVCDRRSTQSARRAPDLRVVGEADEPASAVRLTTELQPDAVILDTADGRPFAPETSRLR